MSLGTEIYTKNDPITPFLAVGKNFAGAFMGDVRTFTGFSVAEAFENGEKIDFFRVLGFLNCN